MDTLMARKEVAEIFVKAARDMGITDKLVVKFEVWATDVMAYRADMGYWDASKKAFTVNSQWVATLPPQRNIWSNSGRSVSSKRSTTRL